MVGPNPFVVRTYGRTDVLTYGSSVSLDPGREHLGRPIDLGHDHLFMIISISNLHLSHLGPNINKSFYSLLNILHPSLVLVINQIHCIITYSNPKYLYTSHSLPQSNGFEFLSHLGPNINKSFFSLLNILHVSLAIVINQIIVL